MCLTLIARLGLNAAGMSCRGKPYVIVFVGVNGVGKSTNLAKIAYWLVQNKMKVCICVVPLFVGFELGWFYNATGEITANFLSAGSSCLSTDCRCK